MDPAELQNVLLDELRTRMPAGADEHAEDDRLAELAPRLRTLWLLDWLDFEVAQGGLEAYFTNSHGRHASLAVAALRDIGATTMASVLDTARSAAGRAALRALTDRFEEAAETDGWGDKLDTYLANA
ncbi:DUF4375 domain-containing protein [Actinoplanes sp. NPDC051861]|uniref:DMP19 family protein n=1 Tax=Actinoplanes sp. NPDC051861 TaxID=3155170 RepID=UPI0034274716